MNNFDKKIAITTGDVNGIGAEITIKALNKLDLPIENVVIISNKKVLNHYGRLNKNYPIVEVTYEGDIKEGEITAESGDFAFRALKLACEMAKENKINAIVTAPVSKASMHKAGHLFNGQTEVLQKFLAHDGQSAEMLFVAGDFKVLLLTRHTPLKKVSLTKECVVEKISNLNEFFKTKLNIEAPKFALCGFNPHAGENGILGAEESEILTPAVKILHKMGVNVTKPLPADTLFIKAAQAYLENLKMPSECQVECPFDCYIANYHDQGLIPIKTVASAKTVNMTIGLDIIRTSPSHGTAFDIAGKNLASEASMIEAILQAL